MSRCFAHPHDVLYCAGILFNDDGTRIGAADKAEGDGEDKHADKDDDRSKAPAAAATLTMTILAVMMMLRHSQGSGCA